MHSAFLLNSIGLTTTKLDLKLSGGGGGLQVVVGAVDDNDDNVFLELFSKHENVAVSGQNISIINHGKMVI